MQNIECHVFITQILSGNVGQNFLIRINIKKIAKDVWYLILTYDKIFLD